MPTSSSDRLNQIGNEYFGRGLYTEAYDSYQQALACDRQSGDRRTLVATLGNLRSEEHTSELQSRLHLVCRLLLEKKKTTTTTLYILTTTEACWTPSSSTDRPRISTMQYPSLRSYTQRGGETRDTRRPASR